MFTLLTSFAIPGILVLIFKLVNKPPNPPLLGIYQQANKYYWIKFILIYFALLIKKLWNYLKRNAAVEFGKSPDGTSEVHQQEHVLEQKYSLGDYPMSADAVFFNGMSKNGAALICYIARRPNKVCDAFLYLKLEEEMVLLTPSLPDTYLQQSDSDGEDYSVQGLAVANFIPMRTWHLTYKGEMKYKNDNNKRVQVDMDLTWGAHWPPFNFDIQTSSVAISDAMAKEPWTRDYFKLLQRLKQTHYEQVGFIEGEVKVNGKVYTVSMPCHRDHTFAQNKDWRNYHRYVYHMIHLENGDFMAIGSVSKPVALSHQTIGYLCRKSDQAVIPVSSSDFQLYQHGENQTLPNDYAFTFKAYGASYVVRLLVKEEFTWYIGKNREAKFYERWCSAEVNGIKGWACADWYFNSLCDVRKV